jgi:catechol 2,3-dioxygenase-like lactoylglutathione lyase family enzyme
VSPRNNVVTLTVAHLERALAFYRDRGRVRVNYGGSADGGGDAVFAKPQTYCNVADETLLMRIPLGLSSCERALATTPCRGTYQRRLSA